MHRGILGTAMAAALALSACGDPVSDEARQQGDAERAARAACYEAAGFTVAETSPAPAGGGNRSGPGGDAWSEGALQAADGTWLDLYSWSEWANEPDHAETTATYQVEQFNQQAYADYGQARAVGRRAYVPHTPGEFPQNAALDACLMMP